MDGTLVDSEKVWDIPLNELADRLGGTLSHEARQAMIGSNADLTMRLLWDDLGLEHDADEMRAANTWVMKRMLELFRENIPFRPGAPEALAMIRDSGIPAALVTNTPRELTEAALDFIGRDHFQVSICGDEVANPKPHPEPYLNATGLLGVDPADCVVIEDSINGVTSAVAAGCQVLIVPCDQDVPPGERRHYRDSLAGLSPEDLAALFG
ncbi:HAD family phosphatase [Pseudonocardiaceae bacterium YIM PH 21723]|nr:HAD family phosphatase [Pseudonocardiaceae bacterium YIM PH 21723]